MAEFPFFRFYVGDYQSDTDHLSTEEHGAYLLLLMHYWRKGFLKKDPSKLKNICKLSQHKFNKLFPILMEFFEDSGDGFLVNKRMEKELQHAGKKSEQARAAAKAKWAAFAPASAERPHMQTLCGDDAMSEVRRQKSFKKGGLSNSESNEPPQKILDGFKPTNIQTVQRKYGFSYHDVATETEKFIHHYRAKNIQPTNPQAAWELWMLRQWEYVGSPDVEAAREKEAERIEQEVTREVDEAWHDLEVELARTPGTPEYEKAQEVLRQFRYEGKKSQNDQFNDEVVL